MTRRNYDFVSNITSEIGSGAGLPAVSELSDVDLTSLTDGQLLKWNGTSAKWENVNESSATAVIPLGGIIAIASHITGAFAIPSAGIVSNGFMYCDGSAIPSGQSLSGTLPNLTSSVFLRGFTSSANTIAGSETATSDVTISDHTITQPTFTVPAHYHGIGAGAGLSAAGQTYSGNSGSVGTESADHSHSGTTGNQGSNHQHTIGNTANIPSGTTYPNAIVNYQGTGVKSGSNDGSHTHAFSTGGRSAAHTHTVSISHTHSASTVTGDVGLVTGGVNGNASMSCSQTGNVGLSAHSITNNSFSILPKYVNIQYVIRVN